MQRRNKKKAEQTKSQDGKSVENSFNKKTLIDQTSSANISSFHSQRKEFESVEHEP